MSATNSGPSWTLGFEPSVVAWQSEWQSKVDGNNGQANSLTLLGTTSLTGPISLNSSVGTAGLILASQGPNLPPIWSSAGAGSLSTIVGGARETSWTRRREWPRTSAALTGSTLRAWGDKVSGWAAA